MALFKNHRVSAVEILEVIPEALLTYLSENTKVDYYSKVLQGKKLFYLLLYGILENDRLSQRTLEDTFNDPVFKILFKIDPSESIRRSSLSERLSKVDPNFFRQIYENIYEQFSKIYSSSQQLKYSLIRVDSTIIEDTSGKLVDGITPNMKNRRFIKYTTAFDGILPCYSKALTGQKYASEENALPEVVLNYVKREKGHKNIYVLDRGMQSSSTMKLFNDKQVDFIIRARENRKYVELHSLVEPGSSMDLGNLILVKDSMVYLYNGKIINNKRGNKHYKEELLEEPFRLIVGKSKKIESKEFWFLTNNTELSAKEITDAYRRRWDIEVFFRFIKQELNVSHLISLNKNGIEVMLYMILIAAMLVLIYKYANRIGYKTAKRRFSKEMRNIIISMIVEKCRGDPSLFFTV